MADDQQLKSSSSGVRLSIAGAIGVLASVCILSLISCEKKVALLNSHVDSPVMASGGSLTFRSKTGWTCSVPIQANLYASCSTTVVNIRNWNPDDLKDPEHPDDTSYDAQPTAVNKDITFYLRDGNGKPLYKTDPGYRTVTIGVSGSTVTVRVPPSVTYGLVYSSASEPNPSISTSIQYFAPDCLVHGNDGRTPPSTVYACEHPGYVDFTDGVKYLCKHGGCRMDLTK